MFASSLLYDCTGCHVQQILTDRNAFAIATPRINRARGMVVMVNALNKQYFAGQARVTCFTCHRGSGVPEVEPDLAIQYGAGTENPNSMRIFPDARIDPAQILDRYLQALGGADRVAARISFVAAGTTIGFNTANVKVPIEIYAKAPGQRTEVIRTFEGDAVKTFDGRNAWAAEGWRQLPLMTFTGGNLAGAKFEATLSFPAGLRAAFADWKGMNIELDGREVVLLQASNPNELPVNFYFDDAGLLVRTVRWNRTTVGTVPTQTDYSDYRDVGGVKMPFKTVVTWTNGQNTIELSDVRPNAPIEASRFGRPAPFQSAR
jgi:hypothetical protein